jgi:hypothetical protein
MQGFNIPFPPFNMNLLNSIEQTFFSPNGGLMNLINSLVGQNNLMAATPA